MADRFDPVPVPLGDGRHDIGDDTRAAIFYRLHDDFTWAAPWATAEQRRHLAALAAASVRALLHELGTLRDMESADVEALATCDRWRTLIEDAQAAMAEAGYREHRHTPASAIRGLARDRDEARANLSETLRVCREVMDERDRLRALLADALAWITQEDGAENPSARLRAALKEDR